MQKYKPDSVPDCRGLIIYLVPLLPPGSFDLPVLLVFQSMGEQPTFIKKNKTYLIFQPVRFAKLLLSPTSTVSSYLTLSPLPQRIGAVCFLLHLLSPTRQGLPVRKYGALCCPDFPPHATYPKVN